MSTTTPMSTDLFIPMATVHVNGPGMDDAVQTILDALFHEVVLARLQETGEPFIVRLQPTPEAGALLDEPFVEGEWVDFLPDPLRIAVQTSEHRVDVLLRDVDTLYI